MPPNVTRLLLSMALLIAAPFVFVWVLIAADSLPSLGPPAEFYCATCTTAVVFAGVWLMIWRRAVRWTTRRIVWTAGITFGSAGVVALAVFVHNALINHDRDAWAVLGGLCWGALWVGMTALVWRESPAERAERTELGAPALLDCPKCGYSLRGLHEARCPECGTQYTLDGLFATLRERTASGDAL